MYIFDLETLGIESNAVILSIACIYFNPENKPSYEDMIESAFFVKLNAKDQADRLKRTISKSTLDWWKTQSDQVKIKSFIPSNNDVLAEEALDKFQEWASSFKDFKTSTIWARGNLDQVTIGSLENFLNRKSIFHFARWRDVRTAVDLLSGSNNGYCDVAYPWFNTNMVIKHDPIHDCAYDAMQLMYGVRK